MWAVEGAYEGPEGEYEGVHDNGAFMIMVLVGNAVGCKYVTDLYSNVICSIIINKKKLR